MNNVGETKPKTTAEKTVQFFKTVEAGDMTLFQIIQQAVAVFGFTRAGKTASCHMLCGSPLRSLEQRGEFIYQASTLRFSNAKVGLTSQSQTQIPNIFEGMIRDRTTNTFKRVTVLDQPGYGDTYGFHRIFSNGYFHYRTFSKTPKLKFIVVIWMNDLRGTAEKFKKTIFNFISSFVNWDLVKKQILKATSLLITKSDPGRSIQNLYNTITILRDEAISNMDQTKRLRYQQFINEMVDAKKIFSFERPTRANQTTPQNKILQEIYDKTVFWQRPRIQKQNFVDMSNINFSVSKEILSKLKDIDDPLFKIQFEHFMEYMQQRIDGMVLNHQGSLRNIVRLLQEDAVNGNQNHTFLPAMNAFNQTYFNYFHSYQERRASILAHLFTNNETELNNNQQNQQQQLKQMRSVYFIKKFKVLEHLLAINKEVQDGGIATSRSIQELQSFSQNFIQMFRKFSILRVNKNDNENIIYKYSYNVQRLIEQSKILTLILFQSQGIRLEIQRLEVKIISQDIFRLLFDRFFTLVVGEINISNLKQMYIQNLNFQELPPVNEEIISFFQKIEVKNNQIEAKIADLIIEFGKELFKEGKEPNQSEKKIALKRLFQYRNKFFQRLCDLKDDKKVKQGEQVIGLGKKKRICVKTIVALTRSLAKVIQSSNLFAQARDCYYSINDAFSIFQMYKLQGETLKGNRQKYRDLLMREAKEASLLHRRDLAIECYQHAYSLSESQEEIRQVGDCIVTYCTVRREDLKEEIYLKRFEQSDELCEQFSQNLIAAIITMIAD